MSDCYFCSETERLEEHHIVPRRFDGSDKDENIVTVCPTCHEKLERLYDKRFYDELGVEKPTDIDGFECDIGGCRAEAARELTVVGKDWRTLVCEYHTGCANERCSKTAAKTLYRGKNLTTPVCDKHATCGAANCGSKDVQLYCCPSYKTERPLCEYHANEDTPLNQEWHLAAEVDQ